MNVIAMPTPLATLADRLRVAYARVERAERSIQEWIDATLELAAVLAEARARFPDNRAFSVWLAENDMDMLGKNDRAALIGFAGNLAVARRVLEETHRASWQLIWRERATEFTVPNARNTVEIPAEPENRPEEPPAAAPEESGPAEPAAEVGDAAGPEPEPVDTRSMLHDLPRAQEVAAIFQHPKTRTTLGHLFRGRGGRQIWDLVLQAIDGRVCTPNHAAIGKPNIRLVLPDIDLRHRNPFADQFDLTRPAHRTMIQDVVLPAVIANREAYLANPADLEQIVRRHGVPPAPPPPDRQAAALRRATEAGQQRIVVFGEEMWPHEQGLYDYDQIRCAIWIVKDLETLISAPPSTSPVGRADYVKVSLIWLNQYIARLKTRAPADRHADKVLRLLAMTHKVADLMQRNPTAECIFPHSPNVEGQW